MSNLGFIEKLLDGESICWVPLGEVTQYEQPTKYLVKSKNYDDEWETPVLTAGKSFILGFTNETQGIYPASQNPVVIFDDFTTANKWVDFDFKVKSSAMKLITSRDEAKFSLKYVYHWLNTLPSGLVEGDHKRQWISNFSEKQIPIPCPENPEKSLQIQAEIVRILDAFTSLTAELTAELTARKKQYNYYRNKLLSFEDGDVEWKPLGDLGTFTYGYAAKAQDSGDARFVRITDINTDGKLIPSDVKYVDISVENEKYLLKKNDLLMARTGATYGKTMIYSEDYPAIYAGFLIKLNLSEVIDPKYYWHFAQSSLFWEQANKLVSGGGQPQFNANALKQVKVPIPYHRDASRSLDAQSRVVYLLDKFDAITSSLTEGLPREIELRQKQYEYYRDLLLSFPKPDEQVAWYVYVAT